VHSAAQPGQMAHSLIPIVVGYIFAHYLSYLVERNQEGRVLPRRSVRPRVESVRAGASARRYVLSKHPTVLAVIKVSCVVTGHIVA
jgi:hypothetical protein